MRFKLQRHIESNDFQCSTHQNKSRIGNSPDPPFNAGCVCGGGGGSVWLSWTNSYACVQLIDGMKYRCERVCIYTDTMNTT